MEVKVLNITRLEDRDLLLKDIIPAKKLGRISFLGSMGDLTRDVDLTPLDKSFWKIYGVTVSNPLYIKKGVFAQGDERFVGHPKDFVFHKCTIGKVEFFLSIFEELGYPLVKLFYNLGNSSYVMMSRNGEVVWKRKGGYTHMYFFGMQERKVSELTGMAFSYRKYRQYEEHPAFSDHWREVTKQSFEEDREEFYESEKGREWRKRNYVLKDADRTQFIKASGGKLEKSEK